MKLMKIQNYGKDTLNILIILLAIKEDYDKVLEGNLIALEVGINDILSKCPRFKAWIDKLIEACKQ